MGRCPSSRFYVSSRTTSVQSVFNNGRRNLHVKNYKFTIIRGHRQAEITLKTLKRCLMKVLTVLNLGYLFARRRG